MTISGPSLRMNRLCELPRGFGSFPALEVLDLTYNNLTNTSFSANFTYLGGRYGYLGGMAIWEVWQSGGVVIWEVWLCGRFGYLGGVAVGEVWLCGRYGYVGGVVI